MLNKKALIIGGTSSISADISFFLQDHGYSIDLTYRCENKMNHFINKYGDNFSWLKLDINNYEEIISFTNSIPNSYYSIVVFASVSSVGNFFENTEKDLKKFYSEYFINSLLLAKYILNKINNTGKIIYISSIAADRPVPQINYATVKGALESFFISLSTAIGKNQAIVCISPGLIYDTPAYYNAKEDNHDIMYQNLATKKDIAQIILNCSAKDSGNVYRIGW